MQVVLTEQELQVGQERMEPQMEQPQQAEPSFLLRMDDITAQTTRAVMTTIAIIVAAFIIQPMQLSSQARILPRQSRTGRLQRRLPTCHQVRGARY